MARRKPAHKRQRCLRPSALGDVCLHDTRFGAPHPCRPPTPPTRTRSTALSESLDTTTCLSKKLASTPSELAGAQPGFSQASMHGLSRLAVGHEGRPSAQRPAPRGNGWCPSRTALRRCLRSRGAALHRARGRGAHRAGPWAAARAGAGRLRARVAKWLPARAPIFGSPAARRAHIAITNSRGAQVYITDASFSNQPIL